MTEPEPAGHAARAERMRLAVEHSRGPIRLAKRTSNLFRDRRAHSGARLDASGLDHVLSVDPAAGRMTVEGMTTYETAVAAALEAGVMPAVVPELKTITVGGAAAGVGIEATSFRSGLVHESIEAMDLLTGDGRLVTATPTNEHADLFFGFPNSYGTLGYATRVVLATRAVAPYVRVERERHADPDAYFAALGAACADPTADFVDGVVFAPDEHVLNVGRFVTTAPYASDYGFEHVFYRSIRERDNDYLAAHDYLWRWDTDWFWCSRNLGAQHPIVRRALGRARLGSRTYTKIMRWNARLGLTRALDRLRGLHGEAVIQDVDIPLDRAAAFLAFFHREIGLLPIWTCPIRPTAAAPRFTLFPMDPRTLYVNFGFWDTVRTRESHPAGWFNRRIEEEVLRSGGIKSLYSDSFYTPETFWSIFDESAYRALKARYDPAGRLGDLYAKSVRGA